MGVAGPRDRSDAELVRDVRDPSSSTARSDALRLIYERHERAVSESCSRFFSHRDYARAQDAAARTWEAAVKALAEGLKPERPDQLRSWLLKIAYHRCLEEVRSRGTGPELPTDLVDDPYEQISEARREAVMDMVRKVVASFTDRQKRIAQLTIFEGLRGQSLAAQLGSSEAQANRHRDEITDLVTEGFGVYVLALDGGPRCSALAEILDRYGWDGVEMTSRLRQRLVHHIERCKICDDCAVCQRLLTPKGLLVDYVPVLVPLLIAPDIQRRLDDAIDGVEDDPSSSTNRSSTPPPPRDEPNDTGEAEQEETDHDDESRRRRWWHGALAGALLVTAVQTARANPDETTAVIDWAKDHLGLQQDPRFAVWWSHPGLNVHSDPPGDCELYCPTRFPEGTVLTLTATIPDNLAPARWMGCDNNTVDASLPCRITLTENRTICLLSFRADLDAVNACRRLTTR